MGVDPDKISGLLKEVRRQRGLSQEELAYKLGISFSTINRWENQKTMPSKLARNQFELFYAEMVKKGKLMIDGDE